MSAQASLISSHEVRNINLRKALTLVKYTPYLGAVLLFVWIVNSVIDKVQDPSFLPVSKIRIKGEMKYVTEAMLQKSVNGLLNGGFFSTDVDKVQQAVEALPWVERASVRRVWPETLFIQVVEQQPIANWKSGGLVNERGGIFRPESVIKTQHLPVWNGPQGSEQTLYDKHTDFKQMLSTISLSISKLTMDKRHAVSLVLDNNVELILGRKEQLSRLQNFIDIYKKVLAGKMNQITRVDLRYSSGMSITWKVAPQGKQ